MVTASRLEVLAARFAVYLDELHDLFRHRALAFGTPEDLVPFAQRLADPAFREEMTSMVRSILYREDLPLSRGELLELLALAVGSPHFDQTSLDLHQPLRVILTFVAEILTAQRRGFGSSASPDAASLDAPAPSFELPPAVPDTVRREAATYPEALLQEPTEPPVTLPSAAHLLDQPEPADGNQAPVSPTFTPGPPDVDLPYAEETLAAPMPSARSRNSPLRAWFQRNYWLPGIVAAGFVLLVIGLLQHRPSSHPTHTTAAAGSATSAPAPSLVSPVDTAPAPRSPGTTTAVSADLAGSARRSPAETSSVAPAERRRTHATHPLLLASAPQPRSTGSLVPAIEAAAPPATQPRPHAVATPAPRHAPAPTIPPPNPREGVFLASSGTMASHLLFAPAPRYPRFANFTHVEGQVIVQVVVARNGTVEATRVLEGPLLLRGAAEHAIRHWKYRPYAIDGKPTDVATIVTVNFRLPH